MIIHYKIGAGVQILLKHGTTIKEDKAMINTNYKGSGFSVSLLQQI